MVHVRQKAILNSLIDTTHMDVGSAEKCREQFSADPDVGSAENAGSNFQPTMDVGSAENAGSNFQPTIHEHNKGQFLPSTVPQI